MTCEQVAALFRRYIDDPGVVGLPNSLVATMLEVAYDEFRSLIVQGNKEFYEDSHTPATLTGTFAVNLAGTLFPTNAVPVLPGGAAPALRLTRVLQVDPTSGQVLATFAPATSWETLGQVTGAGPLVGGNVAGGAKWWLDGQTLRFNVSVTGTIQIWYEPAQTIDWAAAIVPGANRQIDNATNFHDIIALLAGQQYAIKEGQINPALERQLEKRLERMDAFFAQGRSGQASRYVSDERW